MMSPEHFLTIPEIADRLRVSAHIVRQAIQCGELRALKFGARIYRIRVEDLTAWENKLQQKYGNP